MSAPPPLLEILGMTKRFGDVCALDDVSVTFRPSTFHAVLGENGAGKSTLVKCIMGYHRPDAGHIAVDGRRVTIDNPRHAHGLGFGMVYQHFTLVPSMTALENLVVADPALPAVIRWDAARARVEAFQRTMPFRIPLDRRAAALAAGEKQKLEIAKQLFLGRRVLILDEPTSVLTPDEADHVLGALRDLTRAQRLTVVLITHKFREVDAFATEVTVLRGGRRAGGGDLAALTRDDLIRMMIGSAHAPGPASRATRAPAAVPALELADVVALNDHGLVAAHDVSLAVQSGEIVGIAGVSGNGQRELVEVLAGQRQRQSGRVLVAGTPYSPTRGDMRRRRVFVLTEEPLDNACVRSMSVADNLAFRTFDEPALTRGGWLVSRRAIREQARELIGRYRIRAAGPDVRLDTLSGGNVQRTVLARELSADVAVLVAHNPCAGLDFGATAEIRAQIIAARNRGAGVLLISEDLDELLELADRVLVMFEGRIVHEARREEADIHILGHYMTSRT
jgi:general nucleoside transport system ATP-binding protein